MTAAEINATTMSADVLKTTLASALEEGKTDLKITLAADADKAMTTAIFEAITDLVLPTALSA